MERCPECSNDNLMARKQPNGFDYECLKCNYKWTEYNEKQSEQKPQFTEEQFDEMLYKTIPTGITIGDPSFKDTAKMYAKRHGYIIKSPVEEADEMYKKYTNRWNKAEGCEYIDPHTVIESLYKAIQFKK